MRDSDEGFCQRCVPGGFVQALVSVLVCLAEPVTAAKDQSEVLL
jgi:hypothetical protein